MPELNLSALPELLRTDWRLPSNRARRIGRGLVYALAILVALFSYRYVFNLGLIPPNIAANRYRTMWLVTHAGFAATALLIGAVQFSNVLRERKPALHRRLGRAYVVSCLVGAATGLVLALGSSAGPIASLGFGSLAFVWLLANVLGWQRARARLFAAHRRWMIRSWALTLSAVTLRLYMPIPEFFGLPELPAYEVISFLCWVPNLIVAELMLRVDRLSFTFRKGVRPTSLQPLSHS
jgi:uncharacterized membrane protein